MMMLAVYVVCAVLGVGLALIAALIGDHSHDAHFEVGHHEFGHGGPENHLWLPFLSLRFWTYGLAGFGLTGFLLSIFTKTPPASVIGFAAFTAIACGAMIAILVRVAQQAQTTSETTTRDMLGLEAQVLVAIRPGQLGKVRLSAKGELIDMIAISDEEAAIEAGTRALVVGIEGDHARVIALDTPVLGSTLS